MMKVIADNGCCANLGFVGAESFLFKDYKIIAHCCYLFARRVVNWFKN